MSLETAKSFPFRGVFRDRDGHAGRVLQDIGARQDSFPRVHRGSQGLGHRRQTCPMCLLDGRPVGLGWRAAVHLDHVGAGLDKALRNLSRLFGIASHLPAAQSTCRTAAGR